jgi:hypothetical protein
LSPTIVVVQVRAVKIYAAPPAVEALRKNERHDETQFTPPKLMVFPVSPLTNVLLLF